MSDIYETVKTVKGYEIKRMKGCRGCYHIDVVEGEKRYSLYFKTIKSAAAYIETSL